MHPHYRHRHVTVFTEGDATFDDPRAGHGTIEYGAPSFRGAGRGMWHGKELSGGTSATSRDSSSGLPFRPELERAESESHTFAPSRHQAWVRPADRR